MARYNGHPSYNAWNVALWIANDPAIYEMAWQTVHSSPTLDHAARELMCWLPEKTPDGVRYCRTNVRRAIRGI